jgi:hypothetical protein
MFHVPNFSKNIAVCLFFWHINEQQVGYFREKMMRDLKFSVAQMAEIAGLQEPLLGKSCVVLEMSLEAKFSYNTMIILAIAYRILEFSGERAVEGLISAARNSSTPGSPKEVLLVPSIDGTLIARCVTCGNFRRGITGEEVHRVQSYAIRRQLSTSYDRWIRSGKGPAGNIFNSSREPLRIAV